MAKRGDIEHLQTALMGVIRHSGNRKIDVEELRQTLAVQLKAAKSGTETIGAFDQMPTRQKASSMSSTGPRSRSRSKGHTHAQIPAMSGTMDVRSSASTMKQGAFDTDGATPSWYKALKKNIRD